MDHGTLREKTQNHFGSFLVAIFLLHTSTLLAEEGLLNQYYKDAHQSFQQGNFPKAKDQLIELLRIRTDLPEAHNLLGVVYDRLGNGAMAGQHFQTALKLNPDFLEARSNLALHLISRGNLEDALRLVHQDFKEPDIHFLVVTALRRKKAYRKALDYALKITQLFPDYPLAHLYAGIELQFLGELQQASEHYTKATALAEKNPKVQTAAKFGLASTLAKEGDYVTAVPLLEEIIHANAGDVDARLELGGIYLKTGKYKEAAKVLQEAISFSPQERRAYFLLANVLERLGDHQEAEKRFAAFLDLEKKQTSPKTDKPAIYAKGRD